MPRRSSGPTDSTRRVLALFATLALAVGAGRAASRALAAGRADAPWTDAPGVPVELAGDGLHFLPPPATLDALLARAGHGCAGHVPARPLRPGDRAFVAGGCRVRVTRMAGAARLTLGLRLDPNEDDAAALAALPGVGPRLAREIVRDRARRGPFPDTAALLRVPGIGPATLRAISPYLATAR